MLKDRKIVQYSHDLEERIIAGSYKVEQKRPLLALLGSAFGELHILRPQYALPLLFLIGIGLSIMLSPTTAAADGFMNDFYITGELL